ncbi:MAG: preprotein translocase subunit SecG [Clostridia bacterium]|nr:preprotein translocase subunit SecG [Clostridia bacterium]MDD4386656.1 preprotein translocase subunit SecG [Clostridia bacterium]
MGWIDWTLSILTLIAGLMVTMVVMIQTTKSSQSSVTGVNTFYGSNKSSTLDGILSKWTIVLSFAFIILCILTTISIMK